MAILTVGVGKQFSTIVAAVAAAQNGDTINVDAGTYTNQWVHIFTNITLQGVGGMVNLVSTGLIPNGKGIFITDGNITINNFTFSGALVADYNGAGIRQQTGNLVLNNDGFFHNEMGVLTGNSGTLTVNNSEFAYNGVAPGLPAIGHGLYANNLTSLTINNSYFHENSVGHEIKSRALTTTITNSRIYDLNGTASYSIDLPDGGNALIQNNVIEQGPLSQNPHIIIYGEEVRVPLNPGTSFVIDGNTIINDQAGSAYAVHSFTSTVAHITNNKFFGLTPAQIALGPNTQTGNQFLPTEPVLNTSHPWVQGALSMQLFADTGASATDMITSDPALKGTGQPNAVVTLKEGATPLGTATADSTGSWSFTPIGLPDGAHTLTASETDPAGNTTTATLSFTLDHTAPAVSIALFSDTGSSPIDRLTSNPTVSGVGQANTRVTIKDGATTLGTTIASGTGAWSFTPGPMANGAHTVTATQTDIAGNAGLATLSFTLDQAAPAVSMVLPWDTGISWTDRITSNPALTGHGDANTLVTIKEGATTVGTTVASATGAWSFTPTTLTEGAHILTASQTDLAGNTGVATLSFTLDKTVTMALFTDTGSSASDNITSAPAVKGTGEANTLVTIRDGATTLGGVTANAAGTWTFTPVGLADGAHNFSATQTDLAGDTRTASLSIILDRTRPLVSMALVSDTGTSSTDKITSNPAVMGHGDASTIVTVQDGATTLGTTMADVTGAWSLAPTGLANGAHTLTATETDLAGNTGSATLIFTLDSSATDKITLSSFIGPNVASNKVSSLGGVYAKYESDFTQWANLHWNTDGFTWSNSDYYDRAYIFYEHYEATGDTTYLDRANAISQDYLHNYVEASNYGVATWWSMMKGVAAHYFEYGDEASRVAVIKVADQQYGDQGADYWAPNNWANLVDPTITEGREQARVLEDFVLAYQVGGSDPTWYQYSPDGTQIWGTFGGNNNWKAISGSLVDVLLTKQDASGGRFYKQDLNGSYTVDKPFMDGLMNDALIGYYEGVNSDPRIIDFIAKNVKYIYDHEFDPATGMIRYVSADTVEGETDDYTADLNGLIVNGFGFVYAHTGNISFKQMGDAVFAGGVNGAYLAGSKQFNQEYGTSWKYLSYTHPELLDGTPPLSSGIF